MSSNKLQDIAIILGFGNRVRQLRGNLSQERFGKLFGVHKSTVCRWEAGSIPDHDIRNKIAAYGNTTEEWLLKGEPAPAPQLMEVKSDRLPDKPLRPLETGLIIQVATVIEETLRTRRLKLPPNQKGRLIGLLYERCRENREPPTGYLVEKYLLLAD